MAFMDKRGNNGQVKKPLGLFAKREQKPISMNWKKVSPLALRAALAMALANKATLSFAPGTGGVGCTVRIYKGDNADVEFAENPDQLVELLALVAEGFATEAEDVWQAWALPGEEGTRP